MTKEEKLLIAKKAFNQISREKEVNYWKNSQPSRFATIEFIAKKLYEATSKLDENEEEIMEIDNFSEISWENSNYIIEEVSRTGGGEWEWEYMDVIFKITIKENWECIYIKFVGYYNSWDWSEWSEKYLVEPRQVEVTQYFNI